MTTPLTALLLIKLFLFVGICISLSTCSWPKVKIAGDEYLIAPLPREGAITVPNSAKGSGSGSSGVDSSKANQQKQP